MRRYLLAAISASAAAVVLLAGTAAAQPADPVSGDPRATVHDGNVVGKDCAELFPGSTEIAEEDLTYSVDDTNTYVDITAVADGVEVAGVIVKGGDAYNVYEPADLADLAWADLHSPLVPSGKPAQISHWFACGGKDTETTTTTTTTTESTGTTSTAATSVTPTSSGAAASVTTTSTTSASIAAAAQDEDLAYTGFNGGGLVALAAALLIGGGALLLVVRLRGARR